MSHDALPRKRISAVSQVRKGKGMAQVSKVQVVSSRLHLVWHALEYALSSLLRIESVGIALEEARQIICVVLMVRSALPSAILKYINSSAVSCHETSFLKGITTIKTLPFASCWRQGSVNAAFSWTTDYAFFA